MIAMACMSQPVPLSAAKAQLAGLVQAAEASEVVHISRHGQPVAVLLSEQAYAALQGQQQGHAADWPLGSIATGQQDIDAWPDRSPGREVPLE
jgi:prevent-host-death family protein